MKKTSIIIWVFLVGFLPSCLKVDGFIFLGEETDEYLFNDNPEEPEFELDAAYYVPNSDVYLFTVESRTETETESTTIYGEIVGSNTLSPSDTVILYAHGQSVSMDAYWNRVCLLAHANGQYNYKVVSYDYRGYGKSEGSSTEASMYADTRAILQWIAAQGVPSENVILYGFSLGTAPTTHMAAYNYSYQPGKLILEAPMASGDNLAQEAILLNFQSDFITSLDFDNAEKIKIVDQPFLWLHGTADDYLSISNGEQIYANYQGVYSEAHRVDGATHGGETGIPQTLGQSNYLQIVGDFIRRN